MMERSEVRVLVLDDDSFMQSLLLRMLTALGFSHVTTCADGSRALGLINGTNSAKDLILCDLMMPEMDGVEFIRHLVAKGYQGSLILVSGVDERVLEAAERHARAHGVALLGRLQKPFAPQSLEALVAKWQPAAPRQSRDPRPDYSAAELRAAIANRELVNHYQPKVLLADGEPMGVEALVRWNHPADGLVPPDRFVAIAERHGLINQLTRAVLAEAMHHARLWQRQGLELNVAVNVSMDDLSALDFPDMVAGLAAQAGVAPRCLVLEVTESRLMTDPLAALEVLTRLRLKGFGLSIDDFGTGHSSLAQLRDLPFSQLKIDRGFAHRACSDRTRQAIYFSSLSIGLDLDLETVAEGIEDRADWDFVRESGCHVAQGYFIARPMPAATLPDWAVAWRARARDHALAGATRGD